MKKVLIGSIKVYKKYISPCTGPHCKFIPTCSQYGLEAIEKYGAAKGGWMTVKRICRCNPWNRNTGYDPVP